MSLYEFTTTLSGCTEMTDDLAEALHAAGCDDGTPGSSAGMVYICFSREADSLETAIRSAIADVQKAGCTVAEVKIDAGTLTAHR
jgi:hypothetical protein